MTPDSPTAPAIVATFYKFADLPDYEALRPPLLALCQQHQLKGTILLATEGINATLWGSSSGIEAMMAWLQSDPRFADLSPRRAITPHSPFERLKIKLKTEIVTLGKPEINPNHQVGTYVDPQEWNQLLQDPEVLVIDTRNDYEVSIGTFAGAVNPQTERFRDFPTYVDQKLDPQRHAKVAMFCTGGIRCEKATALLRSQGFDQVYHLQGGILRYLEEVPTSESLWQGECFVFDDQVAVQSGLQPGTFDMCRSCGHPLSPTERQSPDYEEGISCPHCIDQLTEEKLRRRRERQKQWELSGKE